MLKEQLLANLKTASHRDRIRNIVVAYLASFATGDIEARAALFAANVRVEDPVGSDPIVGIDTLRAFWNASGGALKVTAEPKRIVVCGNEACFEFTATLNASGDRAVILCIETIKLDADGLITEMRAFFDAACIT